MLIPIGTDQNRQRRPRATGGIIVLNMLVYLLALVLEASGASSLDAFMSNLSLSSQNLREGNIWQLLTYQFAHSPDDIFHLGFNMLFLWIFGSALEDRMGHLNFTLFYLMGGAVAGIAHTIESMSPVIGASGAVCAVTGGFLILFPKARIRIIFFFFLIGIYMIPAMWLVAFQVIVDMFGWLNPKEPVAYMAHLAGYLYGFILISLLILVRIIKSDQNNLIYLMKQRKRRSEYKRIIRASQPTSFMGQPDSAQLPVLTEQDRDPEETRQRSKIIRLFRAGKFKEAQNSFRLLQINYPESVLPESVQLDMANRIQADGDHDTAATAYKRYLEKYPHSRQTPEVKLLLALLMIRFQNQADEARSLVEQSLPELHLESHRNLANRLMQEIQARSLHNES